jgi:hypothetical protein
MANKILTEWMPEKEFASAIRARTGYGSRVTLQRWRQLGIVPPVYEWLKIGRAVMWRERKESRAA